MHVLLSEMLTFPLESMQCHATYMANEILESGVTLTPNNKKTKLLKIHDNYSFKLTIVLTFNKINIIH